MRTRYCLTLLALFAVTLAIAAPARGAGWGDLKLRIVADGAGPSAKPISVTKDAEFCGKHGLKSEKFVINPSNKGVANVIVYLYSRKKVPVHPDFEKSAKAVVTIDNKNCRYEPHVVLVRTGQTLKLGNPDPVAHNSKIDFFSNAPQNPIIPPGKDVKVSITKEERLPARVSCSIHPWMEAWIVAKPHPYMGVTDKDGNLVIKNVPEGKHTFQFWHESAGYLQSVTLKGKKTTWKRGRADITIKGATDLGDVKVSVKDLTKS